MEEHKEAKHAMVEDQGGGNGVEEPPSTDAGNFFNATFINMPNQYLQTNGEYVDDNSSLPGNNDFNSPGQGNGKRKRQNFTPIEMNWIAQYYHKRNRADPPPTIKDIAEEIYNIYKDYRNLDDSVINQQDEKMQKFIRYIRNQHERSPNSIVTRLYNMNRNKKSQ